MPMTSARVSAISRSSSTIKMSAIDFLDPRDPILAFAPGAHSGPLACHFGSAKDIGPGPRQNDGSKENDGGAPRVWRALGSRARLLPSPLRAWPRGSATCPHGRGPRSEQKHGTIGVYTL